MARRTIRTGIASAALATSALAGFAGVAGAATTGNTGATASPRFQKLQSQLETELTARAARLSDLVADVSGSKTLSSTHSQLLDSRLSAEQASISTLIAKVPTDTTVAQLETDRSAMLRDNRVFAVMSPQVFETIGGDAVLSEESVLASEQSTLLTEVNSLAGDPGYNNALNHYNNFVRRITGVSTNVVSAEVNELNQMPAGYPGNEHVFVNVNKTILSATISMAYASYDASIISLATGGYTGS